MQTKAIYLIEKFVNIRDFYTCHNFNVHHKAFNSADDAFAELEELHTSLVKIAEERNLRIITNELNKNILIQKFFDNGLGVTQYEKIEIVPVRFVYDEKDFSEKD